MRFSRYYLFLLGLVGAGIGATAPARGQTKPVADSIAAGRRQAHYAAVTKSPPLLHVTDARKLFSPKAFDTLHLDDRVVLQVEGLSQLLDKTHRKPEELRLFVDGVAFPMPPEFVDTDHNPNTATVRFRLLRNAGTEPIWQLFYRVWDKLNHEAHLGIGFDTGQLSNSYPDGRTQSQTKAEPNQGFIFLELVSPWGLGIGLGLIVAFLLALLGLGWRSNLLRSDVVRGDLATAPPTEANQALIGKHYSSVPFSLSKVQLTFWTFLIISAYFLCYLVTGELTALPGSLLGLLGMSIGSTLVSRGLTKQQVTSDGPLTVGTTSAGFFNDLLAEQNRASIPRLQFLLFNLLVGLYFAHHVWKFWTMPDLPPALLALISISATGFLFGKAQENPAPPEDKPVLVVPVVPLVPAIPVVLAALAAPVVPATPAAPTPNVLPDGTPVRRPDEADDAADDADAFGLAGNLALG